MNRRGVTITESLLALATAGAAAALLAQFLVAAASQRRASEQQRLALTEVANRLEHVSMLAWDELTIARLERDPLPETLQAALPGASLTAQITDAEDEVRGRHIRIALTWADPAGRPVAPVALSRWRFPPPKEEP